MLFIPAAPPSLPGAVIKDAGSAAAPDSAEH